MRTYMETSCETSWANRVSLRIEADLDNADTLTSAAVFEMMALRLRSMTEEVRHANERALLAVGYQRRGSDGPLDAVSELDKDKV